MTETTETEVRPQAEPTLPASRAKPAFWERPLIHISARRWLPELKFTPLQIAAHVAAWIPAILIGIDYFRGEWTVNPIQYLTFRTGCPALTGLTASLACTPLNTYFGFREAIKLRRPLGVYAAIYATIHFLIFVVIDYGLNPGYIYEAIFEKKYALVGFAAFLILLPMALTSTKGWQKRLGKRWKNLHRWVYLAAILGVIHYIWLVKADTRKPLVYAALVGIFLLARTPPVKKAYVNARGWVSAKLKPARSA